VACKLCPKYSSLRLFRSRRVEKNHEGGRKGQYISRVGHQDPYISRVGHQDSASANTSHVSGTRTAQAPPPPIFRTPVPTYGIPGTLCSFDSGPDKVQREQYGAYDKERYLCNMHPRGRTPAWQNTGHTRCRTPARTKRACSQTR